MRGIRLLMMGILLIATELAVTGAVGASDAPWQKVRDEQGITSFERQVPEHSLPAFRSKAVIGATVWELLAILEDVDRAAEWTAHCAEMKRLSTEGPQEMLVYARMDAPWPVRDRDVVVHIRVDYARQGNLDVSIASVELATVPPRTGVVRMPRMQAAYHFRTLGPDRTEVTYELEVDAGGTLPDWLKSMVSRDLAHDTLDRLRSRAAWAAERQLYQRRAAELKVTATSTGYRG